MKNRIKLVKHDVANPLPFNKEIFDIVYSHLSLHYFDKKTTKKIFSQIYKVLKPHGFIAIMLNSTKDPEYGQGKKLEQDFYQIGEITKRYFSPKSIKEFVQPYHTIMLDNRGETYKDRRIGVHNLIRFVGKK
ncbi:class I SAM-dependent methyltransferase, partial [Patescibacteria group bacterium]|nr:class I SAM-dependent methyltransferase [Patescibacteria group bacterium]